MLNVCVRFAGADHAKNGLRALTGRFCRKTDTPGVDADFIVEFAAAANHQPQFQKNVQGACSGYIRRLFRQS